jgi:hypothetical protein
MNSRVAPRLALVTLVALLGAACGPTQPASPSACPSPPAPPGSLQDWNPPEKAPHVIPVLIASPGQLVVGPNRVLFSILDCVSRPIGAPDRSASLAIYQLDRDASRPIATIEGTFVWAIENERGIYIANTSFPESGRYGAEFQTSVDGGTPEIVRLTFDVQPSSAVVKVGDRAPASVTPTLADVDGNLAHISTDAHPEPSFYETSVDEALTAGEPFVLIFATPRFCTSAQCGPTLDRIKPYAERYPSVTFINVEPYKLKLVDGALQADLDANGQLQTAPVTDEWHLFNEPAVYVVDRDGIVRGSFDLIFSDEELTEALDAVK